MRDVEMFNSDLGCSWKLSFKLSKHLLKLTVWPEVDLPSAVCCGLDFCCLLRLIKAAFTKPTAPPDGDQTSILPSGGREGDTLTVLQAVQNPRL